MADEFDRYMVCAFDADLGADVFMPVTFDEDGSSTIITGLMLALGRDTIIERGAEKIWRVDDLFEFANPRLDWERKA